MATDAAFIQDLTVRGELIERTYGNYIEGRYLVNRRYQRKLVWTLDEKVAFIDSLLQGYPVPIILLVENKSRGRNVFEILDGLQRLNAIMSFIENDFAVHDTYFDLNTMAITKALLDEAKLTQKQPAMTREKCVKIASYLIPLSIYESSNVNSIDTVFRRINSGGRKLSRQELRAAGSTGHFAGVVRKIGAKVRGDDSSSDIVRLSDMKKISITNRDLPYGINVDEIFWVAQGILTKDQVRESRDEELIADIVGYMVSETPVSSRSEYIDDFFGIRDDDASLARFTDIESLVQKRTPELVVSDFQRALDEIKLTLSYSGSTFGNLLFGKQPPRAPRYFQAVFLAFVELIVRENMEVQDRSLLVKKMQNNGNQISIPEGGRWGGEDRQTTVQSVVGMYRKAFGPASIIDPAKVHWITQLENILSQSYTEQNAYDFKQGFFCLDESTAFDEDSFKKILKTCVGIANIGRGTKGYVLVGIADKPETASRVEKLYGVKPRSFETFYIIGVDHEVSKCEKSNDDFFNMIIERIKSSPISEPLRTHIARHVKTVRYYDRSVYVFDSQGQDDPSQYEGKYFQRCGSQLNFIKAEEITPFVKSYILDVANRF